MTADPNNPIVLKRAALKAALEDAGIKAYVTKPTKGLTFPLAFVAPGDPYITTDGATFGSEILNFDIVLVPRAGITEERANELDDLILTAFDAALAADFGAARVERPGSITLNGQEYVAAVITASTELHRN